MRDLVAPGEPEAELFGKREGSFACRVPMRNEIPVDTGYGKGRGDRCCEPPAPILGMSVYLKLDCPIEDRKGRSAGDEPPSGGRNLDDTETDSVSQEIFRRLEISNEVERPLLLRGTID